MTKIQENLTAQIKAITNKLAELGNEQAEFPIRMTAAVDAGDPDAMITLRRRQREIPVELEAWQIRIARLQIESDQERLSPQWRFKPIMTA